jgi:spore maturation protein CgeB
MRILVSSPGHLRTAPMGFYCAETFRAMGHEVQLFDAGSLTLKEKILLRPIAKLRGKNRVEKVFLNRRLMDTVRNFRPNFYLSIFGFDVFPETIDFIQKQGAVTAAWWLNDPFQFERGLFHAPAYQFFFSNCKASTQRYQGHGIKSAFYLPHAAFSSVHRPINVPTRERKHLESEVCFVGDWGPVRQGILSALSQRVDLKIWGPWRKHLNKKDRLWSRVVDGYFTPEQMTKIFSLTKVAVNLHSWFGYYNTGFNPRTFETPACGALQACDWKENIEEHFEENKEIVIYRTGSELESKVKDLLRNDSYRKEVTHAGLKRSLQEHTYEHRMSQMLSMMNLNGS